ncbi:MAG: hypothetical protein C4318_03345 [Acidimicrobiia bacterium]
MNYRGPDGGQSTVEFALVFPLAVVVVLASLLALLEVRDRILVTHAARAAARVAASTDDRSLIEAAGRSAAPQLAPERLTFEVVGERKPGSLLGVVVRYKRPLRRGFGWVLGDEEEITARLMLPAEVAE